MHKRKVNDTISSLNKKLNFMARYDALTSLLNRRVFMEDLQYRIREKEPFGLIMFDMDNFKGSMMSMDTTKGMRCLRKWLRVPEHWWMTYSRLPAGGG